MAELTAKATAVQEVNMKVAQIWFAREDQVYQRLALDVDQKRRQKKLFKVEDVALLSSEITFREKVAEQW